MQSPHQNLYSESALPSASLPPPLPLPLPPTLNADNPTVLASATPLPPTPLGQNGTSETTSPLPRSLQDNRPGTPEYYFPQGSRSMPGTYSPVADPRTQPLSTAVPYTTTTATTVSTPPSRRASGHSFKNFLTGFRRGSGKESPKPRTSTDTTLSGSAGYAGGGGTFDDGSIQRPLTPGGSSVAESTSRPSLKSKMSEAFGRRRKSSLSNVLVHENSAPGRSQYTSSPRSTGAELNPHHHGNGSHENGIDNADPVTSSSSSIFKLRSKPTLTFWNRRKSSLRMELEPSSPDQGSSQLLQRDTLTSSPSGSNKRARDSTDDLDALSSMSPPSTLHKRKSGSFWRRKSDLNKALNDQISRTDSAGYEPQFTKPATTRMDLDDDGGGGEEDVTQEPVPVPRTPSPPPVLPELKLGDGLGMGDSGTFMDEGFFERIT